MHGAPRCGLSSPGPHSSAGVVRFGSFHHASQIVSVGDTVTTRFQSSSNTIIRLLPFEQRYHVVPSVVMPCASRESALFSDLNVRPRYCQFATCGSVMPSSALRMLRGVRRPNDNRKCSGLCDDDGSPIPLHLLSTDTMGACGAGEAAIIVKPGRLSNR